MVLLEGSKQSPHAGAGGEGKVGHRNWWRRPTRCSWGRDGGRSIRCLLLPFCYHAATGTPHIRTTQEHLLLLSFRLFLWG